MIMRTKPHSKCVILATVGTFSVINSLTQSIANFSNYIFKQALQVITFEVENSFSFKEIITKRTIPDDHIVVSANFALISTVTQTYFYLYVSSFVGIPNLPCIYFFS